MKHIKRAFRGAKNKITGRDGALNQQPPDEGGGEVIPITDLEAELPLAPDLLAPDSQPRLTTLSPEAELISQPIANRDGAQNQLPDGVGAEVASTTDLGAELPFAPDLSAPNNLLRSAILGLQSEPILPERHTSEWDRSYVSEAGVPVPLPSYFAKGPKAIYIPEVDLVDPSDTNNSIRHPTPFLEAGFILQRSTYRKAPLLYSDEIGMGKRLVVQWRMANGASLMPLIEIGDLATARVLADTLHDKTGFSKLSISYEGREIYLGDRPDTSLRELISNRGYLFIHHLDHIQQQSLVESDQHRRLASLTYVYRPLLKPANIRLLDLLPGSSDAPLACRIIVADLDKSPSYSALSYEWGTETKLSPLICNGTLEIGIRGNLRDALLKLRRLDRTTTLWIDAICINQDDNDEKSKQIQMMTRIYEQAYMVISWLGTHNRDEERMLQSICLIHRYHIHNQVLQWEPRRGQCRHRDHHLPKPSTPPSRKDWNRATQLLQYTYFTRKWILQEVLVPRFGILISASSILSWDCIDAFTVAFLECMTNSKELFIDRRVKKILMGIFFLRIVTRELRGSRYDRFIQPKPLSYILQLTRAMRATNPKDIVFSILNLIQSREACPLRPNYTLSLEAIFTSTARFILETEGITEAFDSVESRSAAQALPSWVPDWQTDSPGPRYALHYREFSASGNPKIIPRPVIRQTSEERHLVLRAVPITTILISYNMSQESMWELLHNKAALTGSPYPYTKETMRLAIVRTMVGDSWTDSPQSDRKERLNFEKYREMKHKIADATNANTNASKDFNLVLPLHLRMFHSERISPSASLVGSCPSVTQSGDRIYIIIGCNVPVVLRPNTAKGTFTLIGLCYVHGIMDGEWINSLASKAKIKLGDKKDMSSDDFLKWWTEPDQIESWTEEITLI